MCIVAIAWQLFEKMPLVLLSNRDEFFHRPTLKAHQWQDMPIFAPRDELGGGTWIGYHRHQTVLQPMTQYQQMIYQQNGKWAVVLNFRDAQAHKPHYRSRGLLVTDFLQSELSPLAFARNINIKDYAGFTLIVGDQRQAILMNNRGYPPTPLFSGLHIITNGQPENDWYKSQRLRGRVRQEVLPLIQEDMTKAKITQTHQSHQSNTLKLTDWQRSAFQVLSDTNQAPDEQLPETGIEKSLEKQLSSICIQSAQLPNYGTRTQSILMLTQNQSEPFPNHSRKKANFHLELIQRELSPQNHSIEH